MNFQHSSREDLKQGASRYGITLDEKSLSFFQTYREILTDWNKKVNLISRRDIDRFVFYHLLDSLKVASCFDMSSVSRMLDFGSGAGLPGIPLAIAFPHIETVLVDSRKKRCTFLETVVHTIPLLHAHVLCSRIENLSPHFNEYFDLVITRATVRLKQFFLSNHHFIHRGGSLISIKGNAIENEFVALQSIPDASYFHIKQTVPKDVKNVRSGKIIIITRI